MTDTVETARLRLEPLDDRHLDAYVALTAQPDVHRYLSRAVEIAADPAGQGRRIVATSRAQWAARGYGPFSIFERGEPSMVGRGGLFWIEALKEVEINYMFDPTVWGRGYATEVADAFLDIGFGRHGLPRMVATTNPDNRASVRVLRKVGMEAAGTEDLGGGRIVDLHAISREDWAAMRAVPR